MNQLEEQAGLINNSITYDTLLKKTDLSHNLSKAQCCA